MTKNIARLRIRLKQLERYQVLLKSDHADLEVKFLKKRLVEEQLKSERMSCQSRQLEMFGCTEAPSCELAHRLPIGDRVGKLPGWS